MHPFGGGEGVYSLRGTTSMHRNSGRDVGRPVVRGRGGPPNRPSLVLSPRSRRPSEFDEDSLNTLMHNDPRQCTRELENVKNCDHSTILRHLHSMAKVQKSGVWVSHAPSQNYKNQWVVTCASLLARHRMAREQDRPFLSCFVTGDEK